MTRLATLASIVALSVLSTTAARAGVLSPVHPGGTTTQEAVEQITRSATRLLPTPPPAPVYRPDTVWVPDRWELGDVRVPGHWERRLPDGGVYVPPLIVSDPRSGDRVVPGHVERSPATQQVP